MKVIILALVLCAVAVHGWPRNGRRGYRGGDGGNRNLENYRGKAKQFCRSAQIDENGNEFNVVTKACPFADPDTEDLYVCDSTYTYTRNGYRNVTCSSRTCENDEDCQNIFDPEGESYCGRRGRCVYPNVIQQYASACQVNLGDQNGQVVSSGECTSCFGRTGRVCDTNATPTQVTIAGEIFSLYFCAQTMTTTNNNNNNNNNNNPDSSNP